MTRKLLSLVTAIGMLYVYLQSQLHSADALFLITSDNTVVNLSLIIVAGLAVYVSFMDKFQSWQSYLATAGVAIVLALTGLVGFVYVGIGNYFDGLIKPFDYIILMQLGITFGICTLSYQHPSVKVPGYRLLKLQLTQRLNGLSPKPVTTSSSTRRSKPSIA